MNQATLLTALTLSLLLALTSLPTVSHAQVIASVGVARLDDQSKDVSSKREPLQAMLTAALQQTRKFNVLDADSLTSRLQHQGLTVEGYRDGLYRDKPFSLTGLDVIVLTAIRSNATLVDTTTKEATAIVSLDYDLLPTSEGMHHHQGTVNSIVRGGINDTDLLRSAQARAVEMVLDRLTVDLFPIRLIKISNDSTVLLNYGQGVLGVGDILQVQKNNGHDLPLSQLEQVATVEVVDSGERFSTARVISAVGGLKVGQIARQLSAVSESLTTSLHYTTPIPEQAGFSAP